MVLLQSCPGPGQGTKRKLSQMEMKLMSNDPQKLRVDYYHFLNLVNVDSEGWNIPDCLEVPYGLVTGVLWSCLDLVPTRDKILSGNGLEMKVKSISADQKITGRLL